MAGLTILTANVNGMRDDIKRAKYFQLFKSSTWDIILLQETHVQYADIGKWTKEWGNPAFWNSGTSNKTCGVGILFNNAKLGSVLAENKDVDGRILNIKVELQESSIQILNVYCPDQQKYREMFFENLVNYTFPKVKMVIGGDFNMVEDVGLDRSGGTDTAHHTQGLKALVGFKYLHNLVDKWRDQHPGKREYTWVSPGHGHVVKSRLDRFYMSREILLINYRVLPNVLSDHRFVSVTIKLNRQRSNSTYWKLNTLVLHETDYIIRINNYLDHKLATRGTQNITQWWDTLKYDIQLITISYCTTRQRRINRETNRILDDIRIEEGREKPDKNRLEVLMHDLHLKQNERYNGAKIRSRQHDVINEEKPSKYYLTQEKIRQTGNIIRKLKICTGDEIVTLTDKADIRRQLSTHFETLYTGEEIAEGKQDVLLSFTDKTLGHSARQVLNQVITAEQLFVTILDTCRNKSPGIDGLPVEFYETFWQKLKITFTSLANQIFESEVGTTETQRTGIITLTRKTEVQESTTVDDWRPITLLCADYKIITKTITQRIRQVMNDIIHPNQTCTVKGRQIQSNLFLIRDIISFFGSKRKPTYIITYDFKKAFDTVNRQYLLKTLARMEFGGKMINFITNIYMKRISMVKNNGELTNGIKIGNGILQGCPLSLPLFCIVAETLANRIRKNTEIIGVRLPGMLEMTKISQFADDTTTIAQDRKSVNNTIKDFEEFGNATSCRLNQTKQRGLTIATQYIPETTIPIKWNEGTGLKTLGVYFFADLQFTAIFNWTFVINKMERHLQTLKYRELSLYGKVIFLNSIALSKIWYVSSLFEISPPLLKRLERLIFSFLWGDVGVEPIKRQYIYLPIIDGGLGLLHPKHQGNALRLKYFFDITNAAKHESWLFIARYWLARRIQKYHPDWRFLTGNKGEKYNGLNLPLHYEQLEDVFCTYKHKLLPLKEKSTRCISMEIKRIEYLRIKPPMPGIWDLQLGLRMNWKGLWQHNYKSYAIGKMGDVLFKIMHNCLPTRARLKKQGVRYYKRFRSSCLSCGREETTMHIFAECDVATGVWENYRNIYTALVPNVPFRIQQSVLTYNLLNIPRDISKLLLTLTTLILFELWSSRNKHEKENKNPHIPRSILIINSNLKYIIKTHYDSLKAKNDMITFNRKFTLKNAICKLVNGKVVYTLPDTKIS